MPRDEERSEPDRPGLDPATARRRAAAVSGHTGDTATATTLRDDPDPDVRAAALGALHRMGALERPDLVAALHDHSAIVVRRACAISTTWGGPVGSPPDAEVARHLASLLDHADDSIVEIAAWACGERIPASSEIVARLALIATGHDDSLCREAAVAALGAVGDVAGLPAILAATTDRAPVRRRAVLALAPFEGPEVDAAIERALTDRDWQVRQAAEDLHVTTDTDRLSP